MLLCFTRTYTLYSFKYILFSFCYSLAENEIPATRTISSIPASEMQPLNLDQNDEPFGMSIRIVLCFSIAPYCKYMYNDMFHL